MMRAGPTALVNYDSLKLLQQLERVASVTAAYSVGYSDDFVLVDTTSGAVTVTLPLARNGVKITVIRTSGAANVTVACSGTDTINGAATVTIVSSYVPYTFKSFQPVISGYLQIA